MAIFVRDYCCDGKLFSEKGKNSIALTIEQKLI
jgi:hypothetical protein